MTQDRRFLVTMLGVDVVGFAALLAWSGGNPPIGSGLVVGLLGIVVGWWRYPP